MDGTRHGGRLGENRPSVDPGILSGGHSAAARKKPLFTLPEGRRKAEESLADYEILYPNENTVRTALRGAEKHHLSWYDAHLWAYAETNGLAEILSEDFSHNQLYGNVRIVNPFA